MNGYAEGVSLPAFEGGASMNRKKHSVFNMQHILSLLKGRIPGQLIIQYTDSCNGDCPQCGMRRSENYGRFTLPEKEIFKIIDSAAEKNIQALSFTGGEPFLFKERLIELINYASERKIPFIRTGTNGFMFTGWQNPDFTDRIHRFAQELSNTKLRNFWISIDSAEADTHEQMRGLDGVIKGIEKALPIFHQHGIYPSANLGINRNTGGLGKISFKMTDPEAFYYEWVRAFELFYKFIIHLGFTMTNACYPMSIEAKDSSQDAVYGATSEGSLVAFSKEEKIQLFKALMATIPKYRQHIRIFTPMVSLYSLIKQYEGYEEFAHPCRGGIDFFFVDAKGGNTYPCGYRGCENLGKFYDLDISNLKAAPFCRACDWECFRDPSEQLGFLIESIRHPLSLGGARKDPLYRDLWKQDFRYYKQCDFFDGRRPMSF